MSYKIAEPLMWHIPADVPPGHRLVLLALALKCRDGAGRRVRVPHADLVQMTGLAPGSIRNALAELADRYGIAVRVPLRKGKDGRALYTEARDWPEFEIPIIPGPPGCRCPECRG